VEVYYAVVYVGKMANRVFGRQKIGNMSTFWYIDVYFCNENNFARQLRDKKVALLNREIMLHI